MTQTVTLANRYTYVYSVGSFPGCSLLGSRKWLYPLVPARRRNLLTRTEILDFLWGHRHHSDRMNESFAVVFFCEAAFFQSGTPGVGLGNASRRLLAGRDRCGGPAFYGHSRSPRLSCSGQRHSRVGCGGFAALGRPRSPPARCLSLTLVLGLGSSFGTSLAFLCDGLPNRDLSGRSGWPGPGLWTRQRGVPRPPSELRGSATLLTAGPLEEDDGVGIEVEPGVGFLAVNGWHGNVCSRHGLKIATLGQVCCLNDVLTFASE